MGDLTDRYVLANLAGCALALAVHAALLAGVIASPIFGFAMFPLCFVVFLATMATHPEARVSRIGPLVLGARMDFSSILRTTPVWSLAITGAFLVYLGWLFITHRSAMQAETSPHLFAALFSAVCAHLFWSGVGTRLGALRVLRERAGLSA
jgi:hypothetical protein